MAGTGGARPGAGRKRKANKFATAINQAEGQIVDRLPELIERLMDLATGVLSEEFDLIRMKARVYKAPPDRHALEYLVNRVMGKPTERREHTFPDKPLEDMTDDELRAIVGTGDAGSGRA